MYPIRGKLNFFSNFWIKQAIKVMVMGSNSVTIVLLKTLNDGEIENSGNSFFYPNPGLLSHSS